MSFQSLSPFTLLFAVPSLLCLGQTTHFEFDGNRMYAELGFVRPEGSVHKALAFVDMGSPAMTLIEPLFKELEVDRKKDLKFRVGNLLVQVPAAEVAGERGKPFRIGPNSQVEAMLPAGVLQKYVVVIDYRARTLSFSALGSTAPQGIPTPFHINSKTGLIAVDASIDGKRYAITIDNGSAYTWFRQSAAKEWIAAHPAWERGIGAAGASNMMMAGGGTEAEGILLRLPELRIGALKLEQVGALGPGPGEGMLKNLFDWYSSKNALPVLGWIGGNVLKAYRLTIDYPDRTLYWLKQADPDVDDQNQVGITLRAQGGEFFVAAIATKNGEPTVNGVQPGDKLLRIDGLDLKQASWGAIYSGLHGKPGETRTLTLERHGKDLNVRASVTAF